MKKNKKKKLAVVALLAMLTIVSATFAWLTATDTAKNHFSTKQISGDMVEVTEDFDPPTNWQPGQEVKKEVTITNKSSDITMVARVHFAEVLEKLKLTGNDLTTKEVSDPVAEDATKSIPKHVNAAIYNGTEWATVAPADFASGSISAADFGTYDLTVKVKTVGNTKTYVIYRTLADGNFQEVTTNPAIKDVGGKPEVKDVKFVYYPERDKTTADWRDTPIPTKTAFFDFTNSSKPFAKTVTDPNKFIEINLGSVTPGAVPVQGEWFYNETDGYFYYIDAITPGNSSNQIVKSVTLNGKATEQYGALDFDLNITVEAIQNFKAALPAADGWNVDITTGNGKLVYDKLVDLGALQDSN